MENADIELVWEFVSVEKEPVHTDWTHWIGNPLGIFSLLKVVRWGSGLKVWGHEKVRFGSGIRGTLILRSGVS